MTVCRNFNIGEFDILDFGTFAEKTEKPLVFDINFVDADAADSMAIAIELAIEWMFIISDCGVVVSVVGLGNIVNNVLDNFEVRVLEIITGIDSQSKHTQFRCRSDSVGEFLGTIPTVIPAP